MATVRIDDAQHEELVERKERTGVPVVEQVRRALLIWMQEEEREAVERPAKMVPDQTPKPLVVRQRCEDCGLMAGEPATKHGQGKCSHRWREVRVPKMAEV